MIQPRQTASAVGPFDQPSSVDRVFSSDSRWVPTQNRAVPSSCSCAPRGECGKMPSVQRDVAPIKGKVLESDVCIVGAGPAGITVARELTDTSLRVILIESGTYVPDPRAQDLGRGIVVSQHHPRGAVEMGRDRRFGGSANLWVYRTLPDDGRRYARSVPPESIDFEPRAGMIDTGWPISLDALRPFFERAQVTWSATPYEYGVDYWARPDAKPITFPGEDVVTQISQHGLSDVFTLRYRDDLLTAENVTVLIGHTALRLEAQRPGHLIRRLVTVGPDGSRIDVSARVFVLAAGGIENAQLLLLSEPTTPGSVGNRYGTVGRFLTDHQEFRMGTIAPSAESTPESLRFYDLRWVGRHLISGFLTLSEAAKRSEGLLNVSAALVYQGAEFGAPVHRSLYALQALRRRQLPDELLRDLRSIAASPGGALNVLRGRHQRFWEWSGGWSEDLDRGSLQVIEVHAATEQTAEPENRIELARARDHLGRNRPRVQWRWTERDRANLARSAEKFERAFERGGIGRFTTWESLEGASHPYFRGIHHPMGSTRMHSDPRLGAVDVNSQVHGISNLYVAGSSVFTTGLGYSNPTLTILALAVRLADHLKAVLAVAGRS